MSVLRRVEVFWRDVIERASKSLGAGVFTYYFEGWIGVSHLPLAARAACFGVGMALASGMTSLASRKLRKPDSGQHTASLVKEVDYVK